MVQVNISENDISHFLQLYILLNIFHETPQSFYEATYMQPKYIIILCHLNRL